jgi:hypothetical protein
MLFAHSAAGLGSHRIFGSDAMAGGTGADRYVFLICSGNDQINGFVFGEGDRFNLQGQTFTLGAADGDACCCYRAAARSSSTGSRLRISPCRS